MTLTQKFAAHGYALTIEAVAVYEYVRLAFTFDPNVIWINNRPCLILKQASAAKYFPPLKNINGIKWSSSVSSLTRIGFLEKIVQDDQAFYRIGEVARAFEGFGEMKLIPDSAIEKKDAKKTMEQRKEEFRQEAIKEATRLTREAFQKMPKNIKRVRYTQTLIDQFVEYWCAPLQTNKNKMQFEVEKTFVMPARLTTAWAIVYSKQAGDAPIDKL
jgi:hypothetical protein